VMNNSTMMKKRLRLGVTNDACPVRVCGCMRGASSYGY
jgi:hypothetical protein